MNCLYFRQFAMVIRVPMGMVESGGIESADSGFGAALFRACASAGDITNMTITAETPSTPAIRAVDMANLFRAIIGLHLPSYSPTRSGISLYVVDKHTVPVGAQPQGTHVIAARRHQPRRSVAG